MNIETFTEFRQRHLDEESKVSISEGRFLSNLFSLSQGARHKSYSSKLSSSLGSVMLQLVDVFNSQSGQSSSNITANVASAVLSQNHRKDLNKIKKKLKVR